MKALLVLSACILAFGMTAAQPAFAAGTWDGYVTLSSSGYTFTSTTSILYSPNFFIDCPQWAGSDCQWKISGGHSIDNIAYTSFDVPSVSYRGTLEHNGDPRSCAYAWSAADAIIIIVQQYSYIVSSDMWQSPQACLAAPPQCMLSVSTGGGGSLSPNPSGYADCGSLIRITAVPASGYYFCNWEGDIYSSSPTIEFVLDHDMFLVAYFEPEPPPPPPPPIDDCINQECSPIVINFEVGGYKLTGSGSPVSFDIAATGHPVFIGWTAAGADEAFLCWDRNHNGTIDSGAELFGNSTPLKNGWPAPNGFVALSEYDDNRDGVIDEHDQIWWQLLLWRDLNHDGVSQLSEIVPLAGSGCTKIDLEYHWTGRRDVFGNLFKYQGTVWLANSAGRAIPSPIYDIDFVRVR
ncbi:MAG TPA: hypothetical protein VG323_23065 [Thermoanaerobaculia bacterium]|nr:hypothetical protein [Thermoanaerobaculia bacterium]